MLFEVSVSDAAWKKYNKRRADITSYSWFGLSNNFIRDPEFYDLDHAEKLGIIYIYSEISEKNRTTIVIHSALLASTIGITQRKAEEFLNKINGMATFTTHRKGKIKTPPDGPGVQIDASARLNRHTDIQTNKQTRESSGDDLPAQKLVSIWNEYKGPNQPKVQSLTAARKRATKCRLTEKPDLAYWEQVIKRIGSSPFCQGQSDRGWVATYDWLVKPDTHVKVMEGKYDSRNGSSDGRTAEEILRAEGIEV